MTDFSTQPSTNNTPESIIEVSLGEQTHIDISTIADSLQRIANALDVIAGVDTND